MKKRVILAAILPFLVSSQIYASFGQTIKVCLNVNSNTSPITFRTHFTSTDYFDSGTESANIYNGQICIDHHYNHGPKTIYIGVGSIYYNKDVLIMRNSSCGYLFSSSPLWSKTESLNTGQANETWTFTLSPMPPMGAYKYIFALNCEHTHS